MKAPPRASRSFNRYSRGSVQSQSVLSSRSWTSRHHQCSKILLPMILAGSTLNSSASSPRKPIRLIPNIECWWRPFTSRCVLLARSLEGFGAHQQPSVWVWYTMTDLICWVAIGIIFQLIPPYPYFFDWHGPSMTIDTACSSSLLAVHQVVQTMRSGELRVAIAAGANLILSPDQSISWHITSLSSFTIANSMCIAESELNVLSAAGRFRTRDADANGYAREKGFVSVLLKRLSSAIQDDDHIECFIRETGIN